MYFAPSIEVISMEVENGIAQSFTVSNNGFSLSNENAGYGEEENVMW